MPSAIDKLRNSLNEIGITQVPLAAWDQLKAAENAWELDIDLPFEVERASMPATRKLIREVKPEALWVFLQEGEAMPMLRALLCICASSKEPEATATFLELLSIPGAEAHGAFRPALFRHAISGLRELRFSTEEDEVNLKRLPALQALVHCVQNIALSEEAFTLTLDSVAGLIRHPAVPQVQYSALEVTRGLVLGKHGEQRSIFLTVCKSLLAPGLMTNDNMKTVPGSAVTKALTNTRKAVVQLVCEIITALPALTLVENPQRPAAPEGEGVVIKEEEEEDATNDKAKEALADPVKTLLEHWVYWTPERAEWRIATCESICQIVTVCASVLPRFSFFLQKLLLAERPTQRMLAVDVSIALAEAFPGKVPVQEQILQRCRDVAPTVRARAFTGLTALINMDQGADVDKAANIVEMITDRDSSKFVDVALYFKCHVQDQKPMVRKAALAVFDNLLSFLARKVGLPCSEVANFFCIKTLAQRTQDEALSVRKAALNSLCKLLHVCPDIVEVQRVWAQSVLPLVADTEQSVQDRVLDEVEKFIVNPLIAFGRENHPSLPEVGVFSILAEIGGDSDTLEFMSRVWRLWWKRTGTKASIIKGLNRALGQVDVKPDSPASSIHCAMALWSLAEETVSIEKYSVEPNMVLDAWERCKDCSADKRVVLFSVRVLRVVQAIAPRIDNEKREGLSDSWRAAIQEYELPPALGAEMLRALEALMPRSWEPLVPEMMPRIIKYATGEESDMALLGEMLFLLGEIALLGGESTFSDRLRTSVQTIATNTVFQDGLRIDLPDGIRGHAVICWGKMCLKNERLAKKSVEPLVLHLGERETFTVRNNVLLILSDLCVQYTSLVDRFVPMMTGCLNADNMLLRKHAVMVLSHLLSEDFIKFKGSIQHRFLYCLCDPSPCVREFVAAVFERILLHRITAPAVCFVDAVAALNGWVDHPLYQGAVGNSGFCLADDHDKRREVYLFLLKHMSNEQKFATQAAIVTNILAAFADDSDEAISIPLPTSIKESGGKVLCDCLALLACKELKVNFARKESGEDDAPGAADAEASKEKVISALLKKNMCENVVPVLVTLKSMMEERRSPFLRELRACFLEVLRDFKDDLPSVLEGNTQLVKEIEFDERMRADGAMVVGRKTLQLRGEDPASGMLATPRRQSIAGTQYTPAPGTGAASGTVASSNAADRSRRLSVLAKSGVPLDSAVRMPRLSGIRRLSGCESEAGSPEPRSAASRRMSRCMSPLTMGPSRRLSAPSPYQAALEQTPMQELLSEQNAMPDEPVVKPTPTIVKRGRSEVGDTPTNKENKRVAL